MLAFEGRESSRVPDVLGEIVPDVGAKEILWEMFGRHSPREVVTEQGGLFYFAYSLGKLR